MAEYGLAIFNDKGLNVVGKNLFTPKLIGTMKLRQKAVGELFVVAEDGTELSASDGSRNLPLTSLRAEGIRNTYRDRGHSPARDKFGEAQTEITRKYEFSPHGYGNSAPLLAAVIHGWGKKFDRSKMQMAVKLVQSVVSGQDLQLARLVADRQWAQRRGNGYALAESAAYQSRQFGVRTGLPFTLTFRCRAIGRGELDGFGLVTAAGGLLYVEMTPNTEMVLHFYDCAGVPWSYFAKCSTVIQPPVYGLVAYDYEPQMLKYAMPAAEVTTAYGKPVGASPLEMGSIPRARYFFANDNTLPAIAQSLNNENAAARREFAAFFEGRADAPLRYEKYNNARPFLKLLSNSGSLKKGRQVSVRDAGRIGKLYTVQAGHNYAKVCTMLHHGCGGVFDLSGGGVLNALGNANYYSVFERALGNLPSQTRPANVADNYPAAPWNPTVRLRLSDVYAQAGLDYYKPTAGMASDRLRGNPTALERFNRAIYDKTWGLQRALNIVFKNNPTVTYLPNPNYDPTEAAKRQEALQDYQARMDAEQARRELNGGGYDVDIQNQIERDLGSRRSLLEMIENLLDGGERHQADLIPFWGLPAYRHGSDRLELYQHLSVKSSGKAVAPDYLPENWILCRTPD